MVLVPYLLPPSTFLFRSASFYLSHFKYKKIFVVCWLFIISSYSILEYVDKALLKPFKSDSKNELIMLGKEIEKVSDYNDNIISLGNSCQIYLFTNLRPASRFIYQTSGVNFDPDAKNRFISEIKK
jgi:hypothetical protein